MPVPIVAKKWAASITVTLLQADLSVEMAIIPRVIATDMPLWIYKKSAAAVYGKGALWPQMTLAK